MSISRRIFIRFGTAAAIVAGLSLKPSVIAIAQEVTDKVGAPTQNDPLSFYTQSTFLQYVNSIFRLRSLTTTVDVTLAQVEDTLPPKTSKAGGRESFVLHFRGGSTELPQDTYTVEHPALGTFRLFLVPTGPDENGAQGYVATINRLSYAAKPGLTPRKPTGTKSTGGQTPETKPIGPPRESSPVRPPDESPQPQPKVPTRSPKKKNSPDRVEEIGFDID